MFDALPAPPPADTIVVTGQALSDPTSERAYHVDVIGAPELANAPAHELDEIDAAPCRIAGCCSIDPAPQRDSSANRRNVRVSLTASPHNRPTSLFSWRASLSSRNTAGSFSQTAVADARARPFQAEQGQLAWPRLRKCDARSTSLIKRKEQGKTFIWLPETGHARLIGAAVL